tara:strand:- start:2532 stop:3191 length:660 start_codon:yes stop_codon:yes gene_type:complete
MKIYTEINYKWENDQLVEIDSKSFDYEGEITLCQGGGGGGGGLSDVTETATSIINDTIETTADTTNTVVEQVQDAVEDPAEYADDTKDSIVENVTEVAKDNNLDKPGGTIKDVLDIINNPVETITDVVVDKAIEPLIEDTSVVFDTLGDATDLSGLDEETLTDIEPTIDATLLTENDAGYQEQEEEFLTGTRRNKQTGENRSRIMANQTQGKSASLLTG